MLENNFKWFFMAKIVEFDIQRQKKKKKQRTSISKIIKFIDPIVGFEVMYFQSNLISITLSYSTSKLLPYYWTYI